MQRSRGNFMDDGHINVTLSQSDVRVLAIFKILWLVLLFSSQHLVLLQQSPICPLFSTKPYSLLSLSQVFPLGCTVRASMLSRGP